ncbi:MAG: CCA tRNA nucleotidyltransferase [Gemmobacter sp.]
MKLPSKHLRPNWLPRIENEAVFRMIEAGGYRAYGVGGCVRDILLEGGARDVDIATDATPQEVMRLAEGAGLRVVPTGIEHGTVTVVSNGVGHEVTTFRRDVATDGRRAVVAYTTRIEEDAARRDFTMNALYATLDGEVIDPLGGLPDLLARRVRFVGDAAARIAEDRLRILRFFRFTATHGDPALGIDAEGLAACAAGAEGVEHLSRERVGQEMMRLLHADDPAPVVAAMAAAGVLDRVLPGADATVLPALVHLEQTYDILPDGCRRLAVMGGEDAAGRLRLSKDEAGSVAKLRAGAQSGLTLRGLGFKYRHNAKDVALVRAVLTGEPLPKGWRLTIDRGKNLGFPVVAHDLMPGLTGAALGARLRELEERWLASDLRLTKAELLG